MKEQLLEATRLCRVLLTAVPLAALLCSCGPQGGGAQKTDAATIKKIDEIAAQERGQAGAQPGIGVQPSVPPK